MIEYEIRRVSVRSTRTQSTLFSRVVVIDRDAMILGRPEWMPVFGPCQSREQAERDAAAHKAGQTPPGWDERRLPSDPHYIAPPPFVPRA